MTLITPDSNGIGRYGESAPAIPSASAGGFSAWLNYGLQAVSDAITTLRTFLTTPASVTVTPATGWNTPSSIRLSKSGAVAHFHFNASRTVAAAAGAVVVDVPAGYRSSINQWVNAYGLAGATNPQVVQYDASTHQVRLVGALAVGNSIAVTMSWQVNA